MKISIENRVRDVRKGLKLSQQELASMTGLSRQAIIAIERKHIVPTVKNGLLIARALHCSLDDLFWIKGEVNQTGRSQIGNVQTVTVRREQKQGIPGE